MPFVVQRVGQIQSTRADRIAVAHHPWNGPVVITLVWNGNSVKHTQWSLLPDGGLFETPLHSQSGGAELALASYSSKRLVSIHRSGPAGELKFQAWETTAGFSLDDDALGPADKDPELVTFGGDPGILPVPPASLLESSSSLAAASGGAEPLQPRQSAPPATSAVPKLVVTPGKIKVTLSAKVGHAVLASIGPGLALRVSLWGFDDGGGIKVLAGKHADAAGGTATIASLAKVKEIWAAGPVLKGAEVLTAAVGPSNALKLQRWRVNLGSSNAPASIQLLSEHTAAEKITQVSVVPVLALGGTQAATAVRLEDGTLKVIAWKMESNGGITRWSEASGGQITAVSAALVSGRNIVTALREGDGRFKASYWRFPTTLQGPLEHRGDAVEGKVGFRVKCAHVPGEGTALGDTIAATQTEDGKLQLFRYKVTDS